VSRDKDGPATGQHAMKAPCPPGTSPFHVRGATYLRLSRASAPHAWAEAPSRDGERMGIHDTAR
jgi:hypothetical protein